MRASEGSGLSVRTKKATRAAAASALPVAARKVPKPLLVVRPAEQEINLGERLRAARKAKGLSIEQVANIAGITKSFLSRLERDAVAASVATLLRICSAIAIRPGSLFDAPSTSIVRSGQGAPINLGGQRMSEFLISGSSNEHMMALLSVIEPGGGSGSEAYTLNAASDLVHIKEGELVVEVDHVSYHLHAGDTFTFPPSLPHMWVNPSATKKTVAIWVIVPPP
jgi:transcriptional regulator with XRE-family HTH domain